MARGSTLHLHKVTLRVCVHVCMYVPEAFGAFTLLFIVISIFHPIYVHPFFLESSLCTPQERCNQPALPPSRSKFLGQYCRILVVMYGGRSGDRWSIESGRVAGGSTAHNWLLLISRLWISAEFPHCRGRLWTWEWEGDKDLVWYGGDAYVGVRHWKRQSEGKTFCRSRSKFNLIRTSTRSGCESWVILLALSHSDNWKYCSESVQNIILQRKESYALSFWAIQN